MVKTLSNNELKDFLEEKYDLFNRPSYIETDPIQIPHSFEKKEDIEISAFLAAAIAWGQRKTIVANAKKLANFMENKPYQFLLNTKEKDWERFKIFKHRTFNGEDCVFFIRSLQNIYLKHNGLEAVFNEGFQKNKSIKEAIGYFRTIFLETTHLHRTEKHLSNVEKNSAAKRINMFLRWMVRSDNRGVDFGLWQKIPTSALFIPLDLHSGNVGRALGLLKRTANDWTAVEELTATLRTFDSNDPVKYDFSLFGLGVFEGFGKTETSTV